jgi:hypothetical protein
MPEDQKRRARQSWNEDWLQGWSIHDVDVAFIGSPPKPISLATRNGKY